MSPENQIKIIAELSGVRWCCSDCLQYTEDCKCKSPRWRGEEVSIEGLQNLKSRDVIVKLIENQPHDVKVAVFDFFQGDDGWTEQAIRMLTASPENLQESLIRAIGKWTE